MVEAIKYISEINAVSGDEHLLRRYILENTAADSVEVDSMGNIVVLKKGRSSENKKIAVVTNIDECGMIVTDITDDGYIKFDVVGDVELRSIISKQVIINNSIKGVIGMKAIHLQKKEERKMVKKPKELFIDIGAKNKDIAKKLVSKGDYIAFTTKCDEIGNNIKGKSLSRIGIYVILKLLECTPRYDTYFVFTVQKEVGMRGAMIAASRINPDCAYILDVASATDVYGVDDENSIKIGNGPVLSYSDRNSISNRNTVDDIFSVAERENINIQLCAGVKQKGDEGEIMLSNDGIKTANIKIPVRYLYTPVQICSKKDIEYTEKLLKKIIAE